MLSSLIFFCVMSPLIKTTDFEWMFYRTRRDTSDGDYDCLLYDQRLFCRRDGIFEIAKCSNDMKFDFSELQSMNVTSDMLFGWNIPLDDVERYVAYLNFGVTYNASDNFICNCTLDTLGSSCQYTHQLSGSTIEETISHHLRPFNEYKSEIFPCLVDEIECNSGLLCIEWRQICDGIVDCENGADEENCFWLDSNTCNKDEYKCRNGMCIPIEFIFDASFDCMDISDEQENEKILEIFNRCNVKSQFECDERLCRKDQFSCGDGQCVHWSNLLNNVNNCENYRNLAYHCEWQLLYQTFPNGICRKGKTSQLFNNLPCVYDLRRLLIGKKRREALKEIIQNCNDSIQYPMQSVHSPVLKMFYNKSRIISFYNLNGQNFGENLHKRTADFVCLNGSLLCGGKQITTDSDYCIKYEELANFPFLPIADLFCYRALEMEKNKTQKMYNSHVTDLLSNNDQSWFYVCNVSKQIIGRHRLKDGYVDCLFGDDEVNNELITNHSYKYQCLTVVPVQYVSYSQLGNRKSECLDGSDEMSHDISWTDLRCEYPDDFGCSMYRYKQIAEVDLLFQRYCDSIWNIMDGKDEQNCSKWICSLNTYQCNHTGQCIEETWICDGEFDCNDGEDERNCPKSRTHWELEDQCDKANEYFCITWDFILNKKNNRPCIPISKVGDSAMDCLGGRDERNTFACYDHKMLGDRFVCDNETKCISYLLICNGFPDCQDRTDELICFWNRSQCQNGQFSCYSDKKCLDHRCDDTSQSCSKGEHLFWCPNRNNSQDSYRSTKIRGITEYLSFCNSYSAEFVPSAVQRSNEIRNFERKLKFDLFCSRGFPLIKSHEEGTVCLCPPSFYGKQCQYNRRRVTVIVRFERKHRLDLPTIINVLVLLICNRSTIIDHQMFVDVLEAFPVKYKLYLLYSRPRLDCEYSIRLEAYNGTKFLYFWRYSITPFDFLPVFRISKIIRFPNRTLPWLCMNNICLNNGTCYIRNEYSDEFVCVCQRGWSGAHCEYNLNNIKCSSKSLVRDNDICICEQGFLPPHCFIENQVCERLNACLFGGVCYPLSTLPPNQYTCLCKVSKCLTRELYLILHSNKPSDQSFLIQLLKLSSGYPRLRQQFIVEASANFPVVTLINTYDMRKKGDDVIPEIGLLYKFVPQFDSVERVLHILYRNCTTQLVNLSVNIDNQIKKCHYIAKNIRHVSVKFYHTYCERKFYHPCFYSENYICYCNAMRNRSECLSYRQHSLTCSHCLNQGVCLQGDSRNRSNFVCVCPKCVSGQLCQFSFNRFSISYEILIEKAKWNIPLLLGAVLFFLIGLFFNGLSVLIFKTEQIRTTHIGFYLLLNSIISQMILSCLFLRILNLILLYDAKLNPAISRYLCKILPYLMTSFNYVSQWLMAFVAVERAMIVTFPMRFHSLRTARFALILSIITCVIIFANLYMLIEQYLLIKHPEDSTSWCIQQIQPNYRKIIQYTSLMHHLLPFVLNCLAASMIIAVVGHSRAVSRQLSSRKSYLNELRQHFDLLIGPIICFLTQLPQLSILFIDSCHYEIKSWFINLTLAAYYVSYTPQISLFFIFILPSPLYKRILLDETALGKYLTRTFQHVHHKKNTKFSSRLQ